MHLTTRKFCGKPQDSYSPRHNLSKHNQPGGTTSQWGVPHLSWGYSISAEITQSQLGVPHLSQGVPLSQPGGAPSQPGGTPSWPWLGQGVPHHGVPPDGGQTENITSRRSTYAAGKNKWSESTYMIIVPVAWSKRFSLASQIWSICDCWSSIAGFLCMVVLSVDVVSEEHWPVWP